MPADDGAQVPPFAIIIPARYGSNRFPGKPLVSLAGATGQHRTLVARCVDAARKVAGAVRIAVATDDARIATAAEQAGAEAVMTPGTCRNGSERVAAAAATLGISGMPVVNFQGDSPLTPPWFVEAAVAALAAGPAVRMATPVLRCDPPTLARLRADRAAGRVGGTTAAIAGNGDALYFSKEIIPFTGRADAPVFLHVGLYAFRPEALAAYAAARPGVLEEAEGLEQLRLLEAGIPIRTVEVDARGRGVWEVNNPEDVPVVEAELRRLGVL